MSYLLTGPWNVVKQLQYIEEVTFGTTPNSPTFLWPGPIQDIKINEEATSLNYRQVGNRDIYKAIKTGELYSVDIKLNPTQVAFMNYGINLPNGAGTIEKSLSLVYSEKINNVENYVLITGARMDKVTVEVTMDSAVDVSITLLAKNITTPSTTSGLTTPTFATPSSPTVWTNISAGAFPLTINSVTYDVAAFKFTVTNNLQVIKPCGNLQAQFIEPTNREISVDFDTWVKDTVNMADLKTLTGRTATYKLSGASDTPANVTATFTNLFLEKYNTSLSPTNNEAQMESYSGIAQSVAVA